MSNFQQLPSSWLHMVRTRINKVLMTYEILPQYFPLTTHRSRLSSLQAASHNSYKGKFLHKFSCASSIDQTPLIHFHYLINSPTFSSFSAFHASIFSEILSKHLALFLKCSCHFFSIYVSVVLIIYIIARTSNPVHPLLTICPTPSHLTGPLY